jgi:LPXTG-motif cell wall-anchored protein
MKLIVTFSSAGWDIALAPDTSKIWCIDEGIDYPKLTFVYTPVVPPAPPKKGGSGYGKATIIDNNTTGMGNRNDTAIPDNTTNTTIPDNTTNTTIPDNTTNTTSPGNTSNNTGQGNVSNTTGQNNTSNTTGQNNTSKTADSTPKSNKTTMIVLIVLGLIVIVGAAVFVLRQKKKV